MRYKSSKNGWLVRYMREGVPFNRSFSDSKYGSPEASLAAAEEYHKELRTAFPPPTWEEHLERCPKSESGHMGVRRLITERKGHKYPVWMARWQLDGKVNIRTFSINMYGEEGAKRLAIEAHKKIEPLLEQQYYDNYWGYRPGNRFNRADIVEEPFAFEGAENFVLHKAAERNKQIRMLKLKEFLKEHGRLFCEVCSFCFHEAYGEIGRGLIEVHHLVPLSQMEENHRTTVEELMCICSNCHFAVHNGDPTANLKSMKTLFSGDKPTESKKSNKLRQDNPLPRSESEIEL